MAMVDRCEVCGIAFADAKIYIRRGKAMCGKCAERIELEDWQYQVTATEAIATLQSELSMARTAHAMQAKTIERMQNLLATATRGAEYWHAQCLEARKTAAWYFKLVDRVDFTPEMFIEDGFGGLWFKWCDECGRDMQIVRPGKAQCPRCSK